MIIDTNRNCNCMCNMNSMNMSSNDDCRPTREEMLQNIKCLNFAIIELGLYLDTHTDDERALCLHRKYCKEYRELTDKYQKVYGPLNYYISLAINGDGLKNHGLGKGGIV